jgi:AraC family transcriptional regulator
MIRLQVNLHTIVRSQATDRSHDTYLFTDGNYRSRNKTQTIAVKRRSCLESKASATMIINHFPRPCPPMGWPNLVIHARGREVDYTEHEAPLSIKCVTQGQETHKVRGINYVVDETSYLLLNHGQRYSSHIHSRDEVETLSIFFAREFAEEAFRSLIEPASNLLDEPKSERDHPVRFVETLYPMDPTLRDLLGAIQQWSQSGSIDGAMDDAWLEEGLYAILDRLLDVHTDVLRQAEVLPAVRRSTRVEQYRRLCRARDFVDANLAGEIALADIGRVACLSPSHLLRLFKRAFGETPHHYVTRRRLARARDLLEGTDFPVSEICEKVGYKSLGSFSYLFSRHFGLTPRQARSHNGHA